MRIWMGSTTSTTTCDDADTDRYIFFSYFLIFITIMYYYSLYILPCLFQPQHVMSTRWGLPFAFDSGHNDSKRVITTCWGVFLQYPPPTIEIEPSGPFLVRLLVRVGGGVASSVLRF